MSDSPYQPYPQDQPGDYGQAPYPQGGWDPGQRTYLQGAPVNFGQAVSEAFKNIFTYSGRASLSAYWWFALLAGVINVIFRILPASSAVTIIGGLISLVFLLVHLALGARRLHDSGRSGAWQFLYFFIIIGWIWLVVLFCLPGTPGPNKYDQVG